MTRRDFFRKFLRWFIFLTWMSGIGNFLVLAITFYFARKISELIIYDDAPLDDENVKNCVLVTLLIGAVSAFFAFWLIENQDIFLDLQNIHRQCTVMAGVLGGTLTCCFYWFYKHLTAKFYAANS